MTACVWVGKSVACHECGQPMSEGDIVVALDERDRFGTRYFAHAEHRP